MSHFDSCPRLLQLLHINNWNLQTIILTRLEFVQDLSLLKVSLAQISLHISNDHKESFQKQSLPNHNRSQISSQS